MRKKFLILRFFLLSALFLLAGGTGIVSCGHKTHEKTTAVSKKSFYTCPMHPDYLSDKPGKCPYCGMDLVPASGQTRDSGGGAIAASENMVRIDPAVVQNIGVQTQKAAARPLSRDIRTSAVVRVDERRVSAVTVKIMGYVEKLYANFTGQRVNRGDKLLDLYSPELVSAQAEYLSALSYANKQDSDRLLAGSRERLLNWDITDEQIAALKKRGTPQKTMTIFSPVSGIVTEKSVTEGQSVAPGATLLRIVDYSIIWAVGALYQQDIPLVSTGQKADVALDFYPGKHFKGIVSYVAPELDTVSHTLMVRVDLANTPDLAIKPGMNATISIRSALARNPLCVPDQAVIRSGLRTLIIVSRGSGLFEPREITAGQSAGGYTEVIAGVKDGEEIVVSSQFLIDAESNLKAAVMEMSSQQ